MSTEYAMINEFLIELYRQTDGDVEKQVSMHDVGAVIGMEKSEAGALAEELIMDEQVELKTLAGGVGITPRGLETLQNLGLIKVQSTNKYRLSGKPVLDENDQGVVSEVVELIKSSISQSDAAYGALEEMVVDIKTMEIQLLSPRPKTDVVRSILRSLRGGLGGDVSAKIDELLD